MKRILSAIIVLLILVGCTAQDSLPTEKATHGIYEFNFSVKQISGTPTDEWEFAYTYNGKQIVSGHQILFSLELFTFHTIHVCVSEKDSPDHTYTQNLRVAICDGGSGKTEITVTSADGKTVAFKITCRVRLVNKQQEHH